jgi:hypothetical protein
MDSASATLGAMDLIPEPDLHPLYPSPGQITHLLSPHSGLDPSQKAILVCHCLSRACLFGDLALLQYILTDPQARPYVDLSTRDEDGFGLISLAIQGFGPESDREVEREECVRLLIAQGADVSNADNGEWRSLCVIYTYTQVFVSWMDPSSSCCYIGTTKPGIVLNDPRLLTLFGDKKTTDTTRYRHCPHTSSWS